MCQRKTHYNTERSWGSGRLLEKLHGQHGICILPEVSSTFRSPPADPCRVALPEL